MHITMDPHIPTHIIRWCTSLGRLRLTLLFLFPLISVRDEVVAPHHRHIMHIYLYGSTDRYLYTFIRWCASLGRFWLTPLFLFPFIPVRYESVAQHPTLPTHNCIHIHADMDLLRSISMYKAPGSALDTEESRVGFTRG